MTNCLSIIHSCRGALILATVVAPLFVAAPCNAQGTPPFKITSFVLQKNGTAALQWVGQNTNIVVQYTASLEAPLWQPLPGVDWPVTGNSWTGVMPMSEGKGFLRVVTTSGAGTAVIPMKTISMTLLGWHDPQSAKYMSNCIGCHGTRTEELALNGTTKRAHSTMLGEFGAGNARCTSCHTPGPNFLTHSAGSLRKQVNYENKGCTSCHSAGGDPEFYVR